VPVNDVLMIGSKILLATDLGEVVSTDGGAHWSWLGGNLPYTTALDIHLGPDNRLYAATHGRRDLVHPDGLDPTPSVNRLGW
jgi:hypothetical protein